MLERMIKMEELIKILEDIKPGVDFENEESLIGDEILDSFDIVNLVTKLNDEFDIDITPADLVPENFETVEDIYNLIQKLQEE